MMQKAAPGQLFFGEDTNRILPASLKVKEALGPVAAHDLESPFFHSLGVPIEGLSWLQGDPIG